MAHGTTDSEQDALPGPFLQWPPPGLERMQGDLWRVAARGALSGGLLVLPLLLVVAREEELASLGPFADAWWVTLVLATVGLGFATDALASTGRILARVSRSLDRGTTCTRSASCSPMCAETWASCYRAGATSRCSKFVSGRR